MSVLDEDAAAAGGVGGLASLENGMEVFLAIAEATRPPNAKGLARHLDLKLNKVYHILKTLRAMKLVDRQAGGDLVLGPRAMALGTALHRKHGVSQALGAILSSLRDRTGETVYISTLEGHSVVTRDSLESTQTLRVTTLSAGYSEHQHARAAAKAVIAFLPDRELRAMFKHYSFVSLTPSTISSFEALMDELDIIRGRGYATDLEELNIGVCCVAAPYFDVDGRPAGSFTVSMPSVRYYNGPSAAWASLVTQAGERATKLSESLSARRLPDMALEVPDSEEVEQ